MRVILLIGIFALVSGCDTKSARGGGSPSNPVTSFGHAMKQGRDISKELESRDSEIADQSEDLEE